MTSNPHPGEPCRPEHFEWLGEYVEVENTEWWCPSEKQMGLCPGPCPDGTPHGPPVKTLSKARKMVHI